VVEIRTLLFDATTLKLGVNSMVEGAGLMSTDNVEYGMILVDDPAPRVRRITLNRPKKHNALSHQLRGELIDALQRGDADPDIGVQIVRGAGPSFSAGYDLASLADGGGDGMPFYTAAGDGQWPRHQVDSWMRIWDFAKPVIAQVHGYCLAGGSELATGCDLVYIAEDAEMGYPAVRFGVPDLQFHGWLLGMRTAMEMMVTGDSISGSEAVAKGWANRAFPADELDDTVVRIATRIGKMPADLVQLNKRAVHRGMEVMGLRTAIRAGTELCALGLHQKAARRFMTQVSDDGVTAALDARDGEFGDYRQAKTSS
jgi:enoyl-CoA hydratase